MEVKPHVEAPLPDANSSTEQIHRKTMRKGGKSTNQVTGSDTMLSLVDKKPPETNW